MKNLFVSLLFVFVLNAVPALAYEVSPYVKDAIRDNQIVDYSPVTKRFSRNLGVGEYVFTKHMTHGSGGFSEFFFKDNSYDTNTTYEFLYDGKLIGFNVHQMKFYELNFNEKENKFTNREMSAEELEEFFPDVKFVKVSDFKNNEISLELPVFHKQAYMLLNDTDRDFYKYSFEYYPNDPLFRNIFEVRMPRILVYSHFKSRDALFPVLRIKIKPLFHFDEQD